MFTDRRRRRRRVLFENGRDDDRVLKGPEVVLKSRKQPIGSRKHEGWTFGDGMMGSYANHKRPRLQTSVALAAMRAYTYHHWFGPSLPLDFSRFILAVLHVLPATLLLHARDELESDWWGPRASEAQARWHGNEAKLVI
ncbi:hypothetical protein V6N13_048049 [Hibiscus sabdariffa]